MPPPALCELLVTDGVDVQGVLTTLRGSSFIRVESFDERAAVELAMRLREARKRGDQREGLPITKNAMKFDRQIVAIALVSNATVLYSDDDGVATFAFGCGLTVKRVADLPVPAAQQALPFSPETAKPATSPTSRGLVPLAPQTEQQVATEDSQKPPTADE